MLISFYYSSLLNQLFLPIYVYLIYGFDHKKRLLMIKKIIDYIKKEKVLSRKLIYWRVLQMQGFYFHLILVLIDPPPSRWSTGGGRCTIRETIYNYTPTFHMKFKVCSTVLIIIICVTVWRLILPHSIQINLSLIF